MSLVGTDPGAGKLWDSYVMYESSCVPRFPYFSPLEFPGNPGGPLRPSSVDAVQRPGDVLGPVHGVRVAANGRDSGERGGAEDAGDGVRRRRAQQAE